VRGVGVLSVVLAAYHSFHCAAALAHPVIASILTTTLVAVPLSWVSFFVSGLDD